MKRRPPRPHRWWVLPAAAFAALLLAAAGWVLGNGLRMLAVEDQAPDRAAPGRGRWVPAQDVNLHLTDQGAAAAPVLVLVAGAGAWAGTWAGNAEALQAAGWRVVSVDLPPFGFSTRPADANYSRHAQAQRLLAAIRSLHAAPVVLLGHAYGGGAAAEAAMLDPTLIRHLILVDATVGLHSAGDPSCDVDPWVESLLAWRPLRTAVVATFATQPLLTQYWLGQFVYRHDAVTPEHAATYRQPLKVRGTSAAIGDWAYQLATSCEAPRSQSRAGFAGLRPPLTLLWGARDTVTLPRQARDIAAATPGSRLLMLPGVGHLPQIEDPARFNARLIDVLAPIRSTVP